MRLLRVIMVFPPAFVVGFAVIFALVALIPTAWAQDQTSVIKQTGDLTQMNLEDLMNLEVTSVSKKAEKFSETAAAVYVITSEDIRRSGATSIAEALRMAPGLEVARLDANKWAITSRGFNDRFANKLLVLIDGRSVYTPLFSGVYWDTQQTLLEDIDRIEVIRGPGASMWGANAVNGVINIITKPSNSTQGTLMSSSMDSQSPQNGNLRVGGILGDKGHFRVYARSFDESTTAAMNGINSDDSWNQKMAGFRTDWNFGRGSLTLQGDIYSGRSRGLQVLSTTTPPYSTNYDDTIDESGRNILARWSKTISDTSDMALQLYYDRTRRMDAALYSETRDTTDLDFQHRFSLAKRHEIVWGLGYRISSDSTNSNGPISYNPAKRTDHLVSAFVQDEFQLREDLLRLTVGSKFEHNGYTGYEVQPNVRLLWTPEARRTGWIAVSRAVRTPCRTEEDGRVNFGVRPGPGPLITLLDVFGNPDFKSEVLTAYELGYRVQPGNKLSIDTAVFYNSYTDFRTLEPGVPYMEGNPPHVVVPLRARNMTDARAYGFETAANWDVSGSWRLAASYSRLRIHMLPYATSQDTMTQGYEFSSPHDQFRLRSYLDLPHDMEFDVLAYYVGHYASPNVPRRSPSIPRYFRLDVRLGWQPSATTEISLGVQNLLNDKHAEFGTTRGEQPTEIPRSTFGWITYRF